MKKLLILIVVMFSVTVFAQNEDGIKIMKVNAEIRFTPWNVIKEMAVKENYSIANTNPGEFTKIDSQIYLTWEETDKGKVIYLSSDGETIAFNHQPIAVCKTDITDCQPLSVVVNLTSDNKFCLPRETFPKKQEEHVKEIRTLSRLLGITLNTCNKSEREAIHN